MSERQFGGGRMEQSANERQIARTIETAGELWVVPWTGIDAAGKYVCPGFEFDPTSGLWCWGMPLAIVQNWKIKPGVIGTFARAYDKRNSDPTDPSLARVKLYKQLINTYLKRIKISWPETIQTFLPNNEEYYVACNGPWTRTKSGTLVARRDPTGARFVKPGGRDQGSFAKQVNASRLTTDRDGAQGVTDAPGNIPTGGNENGSPGCGWPCSHRSSAAAARRSHSPRCQGSLCKPGGRSRQVKHRNEDDRGARTGGTDSTKAEKSSVNRELPRQRNSRVLFRHLKKLT